MSELIDENDGEVRVDVKYNAKGAPRVRAARSNIQLPDTNPVLARMNNTGTYTSHLPETFQIRLSRSFGSLL